jgi:hypothetical protein
VDNPQAQHQHYSGRRDAPAVARSLGLSKNYLNVSLSRSKSGWPPGDYQVELWVELCMDDDLMEIVGFKINGD